MSLNKNSIRTIVLINLIAFLAIAALEIVAIFVEIPVFVFSEGDAAGVAEFSGGNWFDHILKALIAMMLFLIYLNSFKNLSSKDAEAKKKALSFAFGGSFLVIALGALFLLTWLAVILDSALVGELSGEGIFNYFRLETILALINLPFLLAWKQKNTLIPEILNTI